MLDCGIFGYQLIAVPSMCEMVQARKHKKKRINKKWRKRYGMKEIPYKDFLITHHDRKIYGHPKMIARIKDEMALKGMTR